MSMSYGKVLIVDLNSLSTREITLDEAVIRDYVGGSGLNAKLVYERIRKYGMMSPLSDENPLIFSVGPLTGTGFPFTSRYYVAGISPLTNVYGQASSGGRFGPELRRCGYCSIVVEGSSERPVYVKIDSNGVEIKNATHLWGKGVYATQEELRKEFPGYSIACIGPAGEHLVRYAAIINDEGRAAGRTGLGAVMGYKKLKAICLKGWLRPDVVRREEFLNTIREAHEAVKQAPAAKVLHEYGTSGMLESLHELGDVPIRNFLMGEWDKEKMRKLSGVTIAKTILSGRYYCEACPVGCGRVVRVNDLKVDGPEYETVASFGPLLLNDDLKSVVYANHLCNDYGLDTISTGVTIAFVIECLEKGLLPRSSELDISWGDGRKVVELIKKIAVRDGVGDLLAEGVRNICSKMGKDCESFAMHVKGLEMPMHDPRAFKSWALGYATSNRGACHTYAPVYYIEKGLTFPEIGLKEPLDRFDAATKPRAVKLIQDMAEFLDSMVMCRFCLYSGINLSLILRALNAVTGWGVSVEESMLVGERIFNLKRYINNLLGVRREHDKLPQRVLEPSKPPGGTLGNTPKEFEEMLAEYYRLRGWNPDGTVSEEKLKELKIL